VANHSTHLVQKLWNILRNDSLTLTYGQAKVERRLIVVEDLEAVVSASLQRATRLRQSILQRTFSGGL